MSAYVVAVYDEALAWGGPQEGGWWYNVGSHVRTVKVLRSEQAAYTYCRRLNRKLNNHNWGPNNGKREQSSVLSDGVYVACVFENAAPAGYPEQRPRYE